MDFHSTWDSGRGGMTNLRQNPSDIIRQNQAARLICDTTRVPLSPCFVKTSSPDAPKFFRQPFNHRIMAGASVRAELQMPIFAVNIGIGHSVYAPGGPDMRGWYQTFTLKTFLTDWLYISTGYRLKRFHNPGNLMLGMGYRFSTR